MSPDFIVRSVQRCIYSTVLLLQVFFRFVMDLGICPLTGTKNPTHMDQDLKVLDMKLPKEDFENIRKVAHL